MNKKKLPKYILFIFLTFFGLAPVFAQVGIGADNPEAAAALQIGGANSTKGVFIPSVEIEDLTTLAPIITATAEESLLVFNTNNETGEGFYYWNGEDRWIAVGSEPKNAGMQYFIYSFDNSIVSPDITDIKFDELVDGSGIWEEDLSFTQNELTNAIPLADDGFALKFTGYYTVSKAGVYNISAHSDDGVRVFVDGSLILSNWVNADEAGHQETASVRLSKGKHKFEFWHYEFEGPHYIHFSWGDNPDGLSGPINASQFSID